MISDELRFQIFIVQQYRNTPLIDKVESCRDLPDKVEDWIEFDMRLNMKYAKKIRHGLKS